MFVFFKKLRLLERLAPVISPRQSLGAIVECQVIPDLKNIGISTAVSLPDVLTWQDTYPLCASVELNRRAAGWRAGKSK